MPELNQAGSLLTEPWDGLEDGMDNGLRMEPLQHEPGANEVTIVHQGQVGSVQATFFGSACSH